MSKTLSVSLIFYTFSHFVFASHLLGTSECSFDLDTIRAEVMALNSDDSATRQEARDSIYWQLEEVLFENRKAPYCYLDGFREAVDGQKDMLSAEQHRSLIKVHTLLQSSLYLFDDMSAIFWPGVPIKEIASQKSFHPTAKTVVSSMEALGCEVYQIACRVRNFWEFDAHICAVLAENCTACERAPEDNACVCPNDYVAKKLLPGEGNKTRYNSFCFLSADDGVEKKEDLGAVKVDKKGDKGKKPAAGAGKKPEGALGTLGSIFGGSFKRAAKHFGKMPLIKKVTPKPRPVDPTKKSKAKKELEGIIDLGKIIMKSIGDGVDSTKKYFPPLMPKKK